MFVKDEQFQTLELGWLASPHHKGGTNFKSCIPDGTYKLRRYSSESHPDVWRLTNPALDVYGDQRNRPGRWAILIHVGNYTKDIVGCIAVGLTGDSKNVWHSSKAIKRLRELLTEEEYELRIEPLGAKND